MNLIDHLGVVVSDLENASNFYTSCLEPIGVELLQNNSISQFEGWLVYGRRGASDFFVVSAGKPSFWQVNSQAGKSPIHVAFVAPSESAVKEFYRIGLENGGLDNGAPGKRPSTTPYFAAYLIDPDGNNIEAGIRGVAQQGSARNENDDPS